MNPENEEKHVNAQVDLMRAEVNATKAKAAMFMAIGLGSVMVGLAVLL